MDPLLLNLILVAGLMFSAWVFSVWRKDASLVDPVWGIGFVLLALLTLNTASTPGMPNQLLAWLTMIWGARLGGYLTWRKLKEPEEDYRYRAMREHHGKRFWWVSFFSIFLLQGAAMWLIALPVQLGILGKCCGELSKLGNAMLVLGSLVWLVGIFFESLGDWQLARFRANPDNAGKVLDTGLWRYTRHPNYFGDFCVWWGLWIVSLGSGGPWWTLFSPIVMSWLLMKVSGVTLTEKTINERRPEYAIYQQRTSAFFPWPPRKL